jgi:hypothetical protein
VGRLRHPVEKHGAVGGERAVNEEKKPIAQDAYEKLADAYTEMIEAKPTEDYRRADP